MSSSGVPSPPAQSTPSGDLYKVLGADRDATDAELNMAYQATLTKVSRAYDVLKDPITRNLYLQRGEVPVPRRTQGPWKRFVPVCGPFRPSLEQAFGAVLGLTFSLKFPSLLALLLLLLAIAGLVSASGCCSHARRRPPRAALCVIAFLFLPFLIRRKVAPPANSSEDRQSATRLVGGQISEESPQSGEEICLGNINNFTRVADPSSAPAAASSSRAAAAAGWQRRLRRTIHEAIANSSEQVAILFTQQGCSWCDRETLVLRRALWRRCHLLDRSWSTLSTRGGIPGSQRRVRRNVQVVDDPIEFKGDSTGENSNGQPGSSSSGSAPTRQQRQGKAPPPKLRSFVVEAEEMPDLADEYNIEAFPTLIVYGISSSQLPLSHQGFLDDTGLDHLLQSALMVDALESEQRPELLADDDQTTASHVPISEVVSAAPSASPNLVI